MEVKRAIETAMEDMINSSSARANPMVNCFIKFQKAVTKCLLSKRKFLIQKKCGLLLIL
jgi:hypothetical protein